MIIIVLIACTIENMILNRPYSNADTLLTRVETFFLFAFINVVNYVGMISGLVATLIAGFGRSSLDGYVNYIQLPCVYIYFTYLSSRIKLGRSIKTVEFINFIRNTVMMMVNER